MIGAKKEKNNMSVLGRERERERGGTEKEKKDDNKRQVERSKMHDI